MALQKFVLVEGVPGHLVHDPRSNANPRRYLGMRPMADAHEKGEHGERFEPAKVVLPLELAGRAIQKGGLKKLGECVAASMADATLKLAAPPASAPAATPAPAPKPEPKASKTEGS